MRIYELKIDKPAWFFDPPTNRQLKALKFFGVEVSGIQNKGVASGICSRIFRDEDNRSLWEKYVFHTGDESQDSPELASFDRKELETVVVPEGWKPKRTRSSSSGPSSRKLRLREMIIDMLREGSPFDDPVPAIDFGGTSFVFTGKFISGKRSDCLDAVQSCSAIGQKRVNGSTDYLVIGSEGSANWAEGSHGRKIEEAMILRMDKGKPAIISEADWLVAIQKRKTED